jgi:galactose mutarotase-like enzyme
LDFRELSLIGENERLSGIINAGGKPGIEHPFVVNGSEDFEVKMRDVAELQSETRRMTIKSTQPDVVVYSSNRLPKA